MSGTLESGSYRAHKNDAGHLCGQSLGNYRLLRVVGTGAMGAVYEAINQYLGRRVAVKVLHQYHSHDEGFVARFFREARASNRLTHPGVVDVFEVGKSPAGQPYIVMEFLDGETLAKRFSKSAESTVPGRREHRLCVLRIAKQLAVTLSVLHARGVIHRDLKPDNIYLCPDHSMVGGIRAKILDFGVAKIKHDCTQDLFSPLPSISNRHQTAIGDVLGTPTYMAPEQWLGSASVTDRADVYALGGILFELLAGHPPFPTQVIGDLIRSHLYVDAPHLSQQEKDMPKELSQLIASMLHKSPEARPSMEQVATNIDTILISEDAMERSTERPPESESALSFWPPNHDKPAQVFSPLAQATQISFTSGVLPISQPPQVSGSSLLTPNESRPNRYRTLIVAAAAWAILTCILLIVVIWRICHPSSTISQINSGTRAGTNSSIAHNAANHIATNPTSDTNAIDIKPAPTPRSQRLSKIHIPAMPTAAVSSHVTPESRLRVRCNRHVDRRFSSGHFLSMNSANHARISH